MALSRILAGKSVWVQLEAVEGDRSSLSRDVQHTHRYVVFVILIAFAMEVVR